MNPSATGWHALSEEEILKQLGVTPAAGLDRAEISRRREQWGANEVTVRRGTPAWLRFLRQFLQPLAYLLVAAAVVTAILGEWVDSSVIGAVVLINAIVGYLQEAKAEKAIAALSRMIPAEATVRRSSQRERVASRDLVPGDMVLLEAGDHVPADLRILHARGLQCDESALTGESLPAEKSPATLAMGTPLGDRCNLAHAGTLVTSGQAECVVIATGDRTETGHIAHLILKVIEISTPLTRKINDFSRVLLWVILALAGATFGLGVWRGQPPADMFMAAVALAVGAIPEGLPAAVTVVLAIGVSRMARRRAVIRKLPAVETLGSTTVICTDKTGTLTENQMTVREIHAGGRRYEVTGTGYDGAGEILCGDSPGPHPALEACLRAGVLCNQSQLVMRDGQMTVHGDPTEAALLVSAGKSGITAELLAGHRLLDSIPFESTHMFRATLHEPGGIHLVGALERLLERCADATGADGNTVPLDKPAIYRAAEAMAARGLRVLALARKSAADRPAGLDFAHVADGATFLGLQGMIDPPRASAIAAVAKCQAAGISVKMITGDHLVTARAIAGQVGLRGEMPDGVLAALSGSDIEEISDDDLPEIAARTTVFARVAPEQKLRLVRALQARGHIVAMTGDGVNDAPALKQADIGVAMGITGTDVAKGAADMILTDDNFATIEAAVEEGRGVFDNLTKFIVWTLPTNVGEALVLLTAILFGTTLPALPVQLLWINMMTSVLLGLTLVFEPKEPGLMDRPPRDPKRPLLTFPLLMRSGLVSLILLLGAFSLFYLELQVAGEKVARTVVVNVIVAVEICYLFSCRSLVRPVSSIGWFGNRWALAGAGAMILAQLTFTYVPVMNRLFHSAPLEAASWWRIAAVAATALGAVELEKWLRFHHGRGDIIPE